MSVLNLSHNYSPVLDILVFGSDEMFNTVQYVNLYNAHVWELYGTKNQAQKLVSYATSFDSIALTASCYSYHKLAENEMPHKCIQLMWCVLLILLSIALLFAESSMSNLQSVSIIAAFPIGIVILVIAWRFLKDAREYTNK